MRRLTGPLELAHATSPPVPMSFLIRCERFTFLSPPLLAGDCGLRRRRQPCRWRRRDNLEARATPLSPAWIIPPFPLHAVATRRRTGLCIDLVRAWRRQRSFPASLSIVSGLLVGKWQIVNLL
uniref:Uncharacterized protein n=2 Tax=Aegilops tauschii subsp. strangulata TaxID=200361 RepID=A0A453K4W2_AEGTS